MFRVVTAVDNANGYRYEVHVIEEVIIIVNYRFAAAEAEFLVANKGKQDKNSVGHMFKMTNEITEPTYARSIDIQERYTGQVEAPPEVL